MKAARAREVPVPELHPHQIAEVAYLRNHDRALLLSETGTGKSPVMLTRTGDVLAAGGRVTWVTKKSLTRQLKEEAAVWLPAGCPLPVDMDRAKHGDRFTFTTHGTIARRINTLGGVTPDLLIVDEAEVVGGGGADPNAKTYLAIRELAERSARVIFATATPVATDHALDLWALLDAAGIPNTPTRQAIIGHVSWREIPTKWGTTKVPNGIADNGLRLLIRAVAGASIRSTVADTGMELPTLHRVYLDVPLSGSDQRDYERATEVDGLTGHRKRQKASRSVFALVPATVRYLTNDEGYNHDKVIVFTENFDLLAPLAEGLTAAGESVRALTGGMSTKQRAAMLAEHRESKRCILLGTRAMESGLNLQHCSLLVSVVQTWNPARERQREGRLVRLGSVHSDVLHVVVRPDVSLEARKVWKHDTKQAISARVLGAVPSTAEGRATA